VKWLTLILFLGLSSVLALGCSNSTTGGGTKPPEEANRAGEKKPEERTKQEEAMDSIVTTCSFSIVENNIRPDLGRINREIKQTIAFDTDGNLICKKSLTYAPKNEHFSSLAWNERVLLKDLNPDLVSIMWSNVDLNIHLYTTDNKTLVADEWKAKRRNELIVWTNGDEKSAHSVAKALSQLIREAVGKPDEPGN
jgi:hypothetical protein